MMLPDELEWVLEMLGYRWPTADEDKLRESAQLWRKFGDDVTQLHTAANTSARTVTAHNAGESIDAFTKTYAKFDGGSGGDGYLANAAQAAHIIANVMDACAYLVEFAKWAVIAQLIALAVEIAAAQVAAPFTFGLSEAAALGATQATRLVVRRLLDELKDALMEAIVEAMKEPAVSAIEAIITDLVRQSVNVGFGAQQGFDLSQTVKAGAQGGWEAIKQTPQTLAEGVRDSLGSKAGNRAHHAIDSRIDGYGNTSSEAPGSGGSGSDGSGSGSSGSSDSSGSGSGSSGSSNSSSSDSSSSSTRSGIGSGISAETGGATVGAPDIGSGPGSGSGSTTDSGPSSSSSDTSYPRPAPSSTGPTLSDFDDPTPVAATTSAPDTGTTTGSSGTSHTGGGSSVSGLSSPTPHSAPAPTSSGGTASASSGNGGISTNIDSLAASVPIQSAAAPTPATDPAPGGGGGRPDSGSAMPTSPTAPTTTGGGTAGARPATHTPGASSTTGPTSPTTQTGPARTPSAAAPATGSVPGNTTATGPNTSASGPARTPGAHNTAAAGPASTPQSTPASTLRTSPSTPNTPSTPSTTTPSTHTRTPGADGRTPGTPDNRTPSTTDNRTPGSTNSRTPHQTAPHTTPTGRTPAPSTPDRSGTHTPTARQDPSTPSVTTQTPRTSSATAQNPGQTSPTPPPSSRATPPPTGTPATAPPSNPDRTSAPSGRTAAPSPHPGPVTNAPTGTHNQPSATPARPPHQPTGNATSAPGTPGTPRTPNTPQQPAAQPTPPQSTPPAQQQPRDNQVTAVPIPTALRTPAPAASPTQATHTAAQAPGSPTTPGSPTPAHQPQQDSLQDIRADLDHSPGGLTPPDPADQQALTDAVPHNEDGTPQRFPDPFGPWTGLQNDGGPTVPGRSNNCADCSRSFLETWYGNPQVSAPRTPDTDPNGNPDTWSPESDANNNQIRWTGATHTYAGPGNDSNTAHTIANTLQQAGPGSAAIVQVGWPGGGGHAYNAVNHNGTIVWIDTQSGQVSHQPLHIDQAAHVWHIPLDPDRNPIDTTQPATTDTTGNSDGPQNDSEPSQHASTHPDGAGGPHLTANDSTTAPDTQAGQQSAVSDNGSGTSPAPDGAPHRDDRPHDVAEHTALTEQHALNNAVTRDANGDPVRFPRPTQDSRAHHDLDRGASAARYGNTDQHHTERVTDAQVNNLDTARAASVGPQADSAHPASRHSGDDGHPASVSGAHRRTPDEPGNTPSPQNNGPAETRQHQAHGLFPETSQGDLRDSHNVYTVDLDQLYDALSQWGNTDQLRTLLRECGPPGATKGISKQTLIDILQTPAFRDLPPGQQGAVMAAISRLSLKFHAEFAVGTLDPHVQNPNDPAVRPLDYEDGSEKRERQEKGRKSLAERIAKKSASSAGVLYHNTQPISNEDRAALRQALTPQDFKAAQENKGDWSRRNYAVAEVFDPVTNETTYLSDSSLPMGRDWAEGVHSEPHILDYLEAVNAERTEGERLLLRQFYTEREPCGPAMGTDCSSYLQSHLPTNVPVHYGTAFRRGQVENEAELRAAGLGTEVNSQKEAAVSAQVIDSQAYVDRLHDIWFELAAAGHLS